MSIKTPTDLSKAVTAVLALCRDEESLADLDHLELATVLRTAADVNTEMAAHNLAVVNMARILKSGGGK